MSIELEIAKVLGRLQADVHGIIECAELKNKDEVVNLLEMALFASEKDCSKLINCEGVKS